MKTVAVGDGAVGKTCALMSFARNEFPVKYVPTVFENYSTKVMFEGKEYDLVIWDTAGQEDFDEIRPLSYPGTDVYMLMYSVVNRVSMENIKTKWLPEIREHSPDTPFILVATKIDLRDEGGSMGRDGDSDPISTREGEEFAKSIGAASFIETSALKRKNIKELFDEALRIHFKGVNSNGSVGGSGEPRAATNKSSEGGCCSIF